MAQAPEPTLQKMNGEFTICPQCSYDKGFHSVFRRREQGSHLNWMLICPSCGARYDLGLVAELISR